MNQSEKICFEPAKCNLYIKALEFKNRKKLHKYFKNKMIVKMLPTIKL